MNRIKIYQVDAFTDNLFSGNPAAVCILPNWLENEKMQNIAAENNLAETAFLVKKGNDFEIRWFTPTIEVDLCGHATLATAYVLFNCLNFQGNEISFYSPRSGKLSVSKENDQFLLNFPADQLENADNFEQIRMCIGITPR
ncbi:MAG: PhzF family phenazine biosynthesis isomerase, partial [Bacteroidota bacterium]|nr:PhzF family phenazine biosynthesis isomerase [Bacteroidota bacterium]